MQDACAVVAVPAAPQPAPGKAYCGCTTPKIVACNTTWAFWIDFPGHHAEAVATSCCLLCGVAIVADGTSGHADPYAIELLRGREAVGHTGTATALGLVPWTSIGVDFGASLVYQTAPGDRYERSLYLIPENQRRGIMRNLLALPTNRFPKLVTGPVMSLPPVILHEGLAVKIGAKDDPNHYRLARQTSRTITSPFEVWADRSAGGDGVVRYLNRYGAPVNGLPEIVNHLVVANERTGVCVTQYIRRDTQVVADRKGQLLYAAWAAPSPYEKSLKTLDS